MNAKTMLALSVLHVQELGKAYGTGDGIEGMETSVTDERLSTRNHRHF